MAFQDILAPIIVPIIVAVVPSILLLLSKKFEHAEKSRSRIYERIETLEKTIENKIDAHVIEGIEERIRKNEIRISNVMGRLNGMHHE